MTFPSFSSGEVLRAADMNAVGMWLIGSTTFTNTATPFINGCFTSDYQNYLVKVNLTASASADVSFRMRFGTNTPDGGAVYDRYAYYWSGGIVNFNGFNSVNGYLTDTTNSNNRGVAELNLYSPNEVAHTTTTSYGWGGSSGAVYSIINRIETTTQYTGIELTTGGAATLSGSLRVYGYRN
jgi:hypothetical protein